MRAVRVVAAVASSLPLGQFRRPRRRRLSATSRPSRPHANRPPARAVEFPMRTSDTAAVITEAGRSPS